MFYFIAIFRSPNIGVTLYHPYLFHADLQNHLDPVRPLDDLQHPSLVEHLPERGSRLSDPGLRVQVALLDDRLAAEEDVSDGVDFEQDLLEPDLVR